MFGVVRREKWAPVMGLCEDTERGSESRHHHSPRAFRKGVRYGEIEKGTPLDAVPNSSSSLRETVTASPREKFNRDVTVKHSNDGAVV